MPAVLSNSASSIAAGEKHRIIQVGRDISPKASSPNRAQSRTNFEVRPGAGGYQEQSFSSAITGQDRN